MYNESLVRSHCQHACGCNLSTWTQCILLGSSCTQTYSHNQGQIGGTLRDNTKMSTAYVLKHGYRVTTPSDGKQCVCWCNQRQGGDCFGNTTHCWGNTFIKRLSTVCGKFVNNCSPVATWPRVCPNAMEQLWPQSVKINAGIKLIATSGYHTMPERGCWHVSQWWSVDIQ